MPNRSHCAANVSDTQLSHVSEPLHLGSAPTAGLSRPLPATVDVIPPPPGSASLSRPLSASADFRPRPPASAKLRLISVDFRRPPPTSTNLRRPQPTSAGPNRPPPTSSAGLRRAETQDSETLSGSARLGPLGEGRGGGHPGKARNPRLTPKIVPKMGPRLRFGLRLAAPAPVFTDPPLFNDSEAAHWTFKIAFLAKAWLPWHIFFVIQIRPILIMHHARYRLSLVHCCLMYRLILPGYAARVHAKRAGTELRARSACTPHSQNKPHAHVMVEGTLLVILPIAAVQFCSAMS